MRSVRIEKERMFDIKTITQQGKNYKRKSNICLMKICKMVSRFLETDRKYGMIEL